MADLATVAQLAAYLGEPLDNADASAILAINLASAMIRGHLGYDPIQATTTELLDPIGGSYVFLPNMPVTAVSLVETYDTSTGVGLWTTADPSLYTVSRRLGIVSASAYLASGSPWPTNPETWRVTYTHGWATLPDGILNAVLGLAARQYANPAAVNSESVGSYRVQYAPQSGLIPQEILSLRPYQYGNLS